MSAQESKAIAVAKRHLELQYGHPLRATFTIASAEWGFQVNFANVECNSGAHGTWARVPEGFGEVFLSRDLDVIQASIGP